MKTKQYTKEQEQIARFAKAMGHPARMAILNFLAKQDSCFFGDIHEELPIAKATVSQHLKELKDAGLIQANPPDVTVNISDSYLDVPNAFSPGTSPGINDEFRVAYRSLTRFKCWIFNRWGVEMYHWTDPSKGWDGKKGGKYVAPGVYFYVIEATGSDGKPIKRKGSINILRSKQIQDEIIEE